MSWNVLTRNFSHFFNFGQVLAMKFQYLHDKCFFNPIVDAPVITGVRSKSYKLTQFYCFILLVRGLWWLSISISLCKMYRSTFVLTSEINFWVAAVKFHVRWSVKRCAWVAVGAISYFVKLFQRVLWQTSSIHPDVLFRYRYDVKPWEFENCCM